MNALKYWSDPVVYDPTLKKWFFWDETWAYRIGPYDTQEIARAELQRYIEENGLT
jgi:hypothetical protein